VVDVPPLATLDHLEVPQSESPLDEPVNSLASGSLNESRVLPAQEVAGMNGDQIEE
jgi:hypothetical protein